MYSKYQIGKYIVEEEQQGKQRAEYGKQVLKGLSIRLTEAYRDGWSYENLNLCKKLYLLYSNSVNTDHKISNDHEINELEPISEIVNTDKKELQAKLQEWMEEFEE